MDQRHFASGSYLDRNNLVPINHVTPPGFLLLSTYLPSYNAFLTYSSRKLPDGKLTWEDKPTDCAEDTATLCETTTSYGVTTIKGTPSTTATATPSVCQTILGCDLSDEDKTKTTTKGAACTKPPAALGKRAVQSSISPDNPVATFYPKEPNGNPAEPNDQDEWKGDWDGCKEGKKAICYPAYVGSGIPDLPRRRLIRSGIQFTEIRSNALDFTAFFYIESLPADFMDRLNNWMDPRVWF